MHVKTISLIIGLFLYLPETEAKLPVFENKLAPFTTDGCSAIPDFNFRHCCKLHDLAYWKGGTEEEKIQANDQFNQCVSQVNHKVIGRVHFLFVL